MRDRGKKSLDRGYKRMNNEEYQEQFNIEPTSIIMDPCNHEFEVDGGPCIYCGWTWLDINCSCE